VSGALSLVLLGLLGVAQDAAQPKGAAAKPADTLWAHVLLQPGPVAERLAGLPEAPPAALGKPWPDWSDRSEAGWGGELVWRRWVELLRAEAKTSTPARRAELAVLARLQGRDADAWTHLLACAGEPGLVTALLPLFAPGIPPELAARGEPLPDGVLLRPALPPSADPRGGLRWLAGRHIERQELALGGAHCSIAVTVDRDGLEVKLVHTGGAPARVRILPPLPRGVDAGQVFLDWEKHPPDAGPFEFVLDAATPEHSLWLTFHPPEESWPNPPLETLARPAPGRSIQLVSPRGDEAHLARFAEALGELLGVPAGLRPASAAPAPGLEPLVLRFDAPASDERKLVELVSLAEAFALRGAGR
jgi:hypothetical protein